MCMHYGYRAALIVGVIIFGYMIGWSVRDDGKVIALDRNIYLPGRPKIVVRQISEKPSFFGLRFYGLEDNFLYRFEYYIYDSGAIYSCQTYSGTSYRANSAQIEWKSDGTAIATLDHNLSFRCDSKGMWKKI